MVGYIYLIIDLTNWKKYVGQHHYHLEKLDSNYHGSGTIISKIYKKRPETLKEVYLKTCYTQEELDEWEQYYIKFYNTLYPNGYNLEEGGRGGVPSEETRMRMSEAHKGLYVGEKHPNYGKKASDETRRKLSKSHKGLCAGEKHPMFGKHHSEESKKKLSEKLKGEKNPFYGRHHSEESKQKMREYRKGKTMSEEVKKKLSKKVLQFTLDGEFVREWPSTRECGRNGFDSGAVGKCCQGKLKQYKGFRWEYKKEVV